MKSKTNHRSVLLAANFLHIFGQSMLITIYALFALKIGTTPLQIGATIALFNLVAGFTNIITGRFEDGKARMKSFVLAGYLITLFAMILYLFVTKPSQLYAVQIIAAIGTGIYMPAWKSLYTRSQIKGKEASLWGLFDGGNMIAMAGGAAISGWLANSNDYNLIFISIVLIYSVATGFVIMLPTKSR